MTGPPGPLVYKIATREQWEAAVAAGVFRGAPVDVEDGFIHLSTADQVRETAARHFAERTDLVLVSVDAASLGDALRHEPSRGGALFPHLHGELPLAAVRGVEPLPLDPGGRHVFPAAIPGPAQSPLGRPGRPSRPVR